MKTIIAFIVGWFKGRKSSGTANDIYVPPKY